VAVNNKQPVCPSRGSLRIGVKMLKLRYRKVVISLASRGDADNLIIR
jgi:hypothetical protein